MERKKNSKLASAPANKYYNIRIMILVVLHAVGLLGMIFEETRPYFILVTPVHLVICSMVLFFDKDILELGYLYFALFTFVVSMTSEAIGVASGVLFGEYYYTSVLGTKLFDVPLVIGVLWIGLVYSANQLANRLTTNKLVAAFTAAVFLVLMDILIEQFALFSGMWIWKTSYIPNYNYLTWFMVGLVCSVFFQYVAPKKQEEVSFPYLGIQSLFFLGIILFENGLDLRFW
jgi:putative membrane protein